MSLGDLVQILQTTCVRMGLFYTMKAQLEYVSQGSVSDNLFLIYVHVSLTFPLSEIMFYNTKILHTELNLQNK